MARIPGPRGARLAAALLAAAALAAPAVHAQDLPSLFVRVTDAAGVPVTDLRPEDVVILEDGQERVTVTVEPIDWPVRLTVLVDNSRAMTQPLGQIREGLRGLIDALPDGVEMELLSTAPQPRFMTRLTADHAALLEGVDLIVPDSGSAAFVDGLVEASDRIRDDDRNVFPVVVMVAANGPDPALSGGIDRKFQRLQEQTFARAATYHVVVWTAPGITQGQVSGAVQTIVGTQMTDITGGRYEALAATSRFTTLLPEIGEQIARSHEWQRTQYRVSYLRPADADPPQQGIGANILRPGLQGALSFDGRLP